MSNAESFFKLLDRIPQPANSIQAEYVWIGGSGQDVRSKSRTLDFVPTSPSQLPEWNYDGSSTGQATGKDSEIVIKARAIFRDPFRLGNNILVMCDTYSPLDSKPIPTNTRAACVEVMEKAKSQKPWFGIEQEYTLFTTEKHPLGWPKGGYPGPQGPYYCSAGADNAFGRHVAELHYRACLYAGIKVSGINAEVLPGQWEYQVGPCEGIDAGDQMWMSRYIMHRVCELFDVVCSFDPKPIPGDWNGSGCHTNFSTLAMRTPVIGYGEIEKGCKKLASTHNEHIAVYGEGNERRLLGSHETSSIRDFSIGVGNRGCSIRIPNSAKAEGCGYFEDRRPASNMDPYLVTRKLVESICLSNDDPK